MSEEVRVTSSTGAEKGTKLERMDLLPPEALLALSRIYGFGAKKYADHNFRKGYDWGLSYAAMQRHLNAFWSGEDLDPESGQPHIMHAAWHCFALYMFSLEHPDFDDRLSTIRKQSVTQNLPEESLVEIEDEIQETLKNITIVSSPAGTWTTTTTNGGFTKLDPVHRNGCCGNCQFGCLVAKGEIEDAKKTGNLTRYGVPNSKAAPNTPAPDWIDDV